MAIRYEPLDGGMAVAVDDFCGFGADALFLARFASPRPGERVVDLGTGCGILPVLLLRDSAAAHVTGVEIQPAAAALARRSVARSGLDGRAAARGGLLHDLYLYNWRDKASHPGIRHAVQHPEVALKNARARFSVTETEADIIRSHMFPLTPTRVYHCLGALVVSTMDKLCAAAELLGLVPWLTRRRARPIWQDADWAPAPLRRAG